MLAAGALVLFAVLYVLVITDPVGSSTGNWRTTSSGSAIDNPGTFLATLLDSITFAGWLFIVASGFSLIFGLMRVVNMTTAPLPPGWLHRVRDPTGDDRERIHRRLNEVNTWSGQLLLVAAAASPSSASSPSRRSALNQGHDLRQAPITIAVL